MTAYFQHVGEAGGARDFPRTIGTPKAGLRHFTYADVESHLTQLPSVEADSADAAEKAEEYIAIPRVGACGV
jgi:hypothetical protein